MNDFQKIIDKANDLKNKIEKEITSINELYDQTFADITNSYKRKHEELEKESQERKIR